MPTPTWGAAGVGGSVTIDEFTDPELAHSPHREQLGTLKAVQSEIASETARLAEEVRRMSQSVKESAQRVNEMPELIDVPVKPAVPSRVRRWHFVGHGWRPHVHHVDLFVPLSTCKLDSWQRFLSG